MIQPVTGVLRMKLLIQMGGRNAQAVRKPRVPPSRGQLGKAGLAPLRRRGPSVYRSARAVITKSYRPGS